MIIDARSEKVINTTNVTVDMPRFYRGSRRMRRRMIPPLVSYKHQENKVLSYTGALANDQFVLYFGGPPGVEPAQPNVVPAGHRVSTVDVSVNFSATSASTTGDYSWMLVKLRQDQLVNTLFGATGAAQWSTIGLSNGRNQVIKSYMGVYGTEDSTPIRYNVRIKIPASMQRVREGDQLVLVFNAGDAGTYHVGFRYKDYS